MALAISELNAVSKKYFDGTITQQIYEESPFYAKLYGNKKVIIDGGKSLQWTVRISKLGSAQSTLPRAKVDFQSTETRAGADLDWPYYDVKSMIHWDEKLKNAGDGRIIDLIKDRTVEMKEDMQDRLSTDLYQTSQLSGKMVPLAVIIDATATYAGILYTDGDGDWKSTEDASTTQLVLDGAGSLSYMRNQATFGKNQPDLHLTTRDLASKFHSLLQPQQRYEDPEMANYGFSNITFYKKPVIGDPYCTANSWFGIDMSAFELWVHKDNNMKVKDWFSLEQAGFPNAAARYGVWVGNIVVRCRRTSFKYTALDYTK